MRKVLFILLLLVIGLVGCSNNTNKTEQTDSPEVGKEDTEVNKNEATKEDEAEFEQEQELNRPEDISEEVWKIMDDETKKNIIDISAQTNETEKELYINMMNMLLNEFDDEYEKFDIEIGMNLYKVIKGFADEDIELAKNMKDKLTEVFDDDEQLIYKEFYDKVIEFEESSSHIDWSE